MAFYETTLVFRQEISSADAEKLADSLIAPVKEMGGSIIKRENWGLRNLAYKIQKNKKGYYVHFGYEAGADAVSELNRKLRITEDVIRNLTIRVENIKEGESAILRADNDDEE
jgi:small subunit ribosomal protein S6